MSMETEEIEHQYPLSGMTGHTEDENCPCRPVIQDDDYGRQIRHFDFTHQTEMELLDLAQWAYTAFTEIAIDSTDRRIIEIAKTGINGFSKFL